MASATWKRDFASGLIILLPVLVTIYVLAYLYGILASVPLAAVITNQTLVSLGIPENANYAPQVLTFVRVVTTLAVFVLLVFSIGYLMRTAFGDLVERTLDDVMNQVPGLRVVYNASKMAVETAVSGADDLQKPVKLEVWDGLRMTAFKTGKTTDDGRDVLFLPTAPNITTGFVIEVHPDEYEEINERVEDALTRILSAGFGDADENQRKVPAGLADPEAETDDD